MSEKNLAATVNLFAASAAKTCGTAVAVTCQGSILGIRTLCSKLKNSLTYSDEEKNDLALSKLEKALFFAGQSLPTIQEDVALRKAFLQLELPGISDDYICSRLSKTLIQRAAFKTGAVGGLTSAPGTIPGIGTLGTIAATMTADIVHKFRVQIELCYAIAAAYECEIDEQELQATALAIIGISVSETTFGRLGGQATKEMIDSARVYLATGMAKGASRIVEKVTIRGSRALRIIPFLGIPLGAYLNLKDAHRVGRQARKYFHSIKFPHPETERNLT